MGFAYSLPRLKFRQALEERTRSLEIGVALRDGAFRSANEFLLRAAQFFGRSAQPLIVLARCMEGTCAADEFHAPILTHLGAPPDKQRPDLARALHVSSPARLEVGSLNLYGPQDTLAIDLLAHPEFGQVLRSAISNGNGAIFKNN
jgi:hypothetical protein